MSLFEIGMTICGYMGVRMVIIISWKDCILLKIVVVLHFQISGWRCWIWVT